MEHENWQAGSLKTSTEVKGEVLEGDKEGSKERLGTEWQS